MTFVHDLSFPPLIKGEAIKATSDPFSKAISRAGTGCDPGLIVYSQYDNAARLALVLAPETALETAIGVVFSASLGLSDSLGALAPPEVAVHFTWPDRFKVNGAYCGHMRVASATHDPTEIPDWLVVGIDVPILPSGHDDVGNNPYETVLYEEGCGEITAVALIESWSRHTLYWINRFVDEGFSPIHKNWCGKCDDIGGEMTEGTFLGLDEKGGMLLRNKDKTTVVPLTSILENSV